MPTEDAGWLGMPPGEPMVGKTYRADGWVYREVARCSPESWDRILGMIGEERGSPMIITRYFDDGFRYGYIWKRGPVWLHILSVETGDTLKLPVGDERYMKDVMSALTGKTNARLIRREHKRRGHDLTQDLKAALKQLEEATG